MLSRVFHLESRDGSPAPHSDYPQRGDWQVGIFRPVDHAPALSGANGRGTPLDLDGSATSEAQIGLRPVVPCSNRGRKFKGGSLKRFWRISLAGGIALIASSVLGAVSVGAGASELSARSSASSSPKIGIVVSNFACGSSVNGKVLWPDASLSRVSSNTSDDREQTVMQLFDGTTELEQLGAGEVQSNGTVTQSDLATIPEGDTIDVKPWGAKFGDGSQFGGAPLTPNHTYTVNVVITDYSYNQASAVTSFSCLTSIDTDGDGVPDSADNCYAHANPNQADVDQDGVGNACDTPTPVSGCGHPVDVTFEVTAQMGTGADPRPQSNGCWQWERPGPTSGGGFRATGFPDAREHWWNCRGNTQSAPLRPLTPGYWIYDDVASTAPTSGVDPLLLACTNAAAKVTNPTAAQRQATRGILITFDRPATGAPVSVMSAASENHYTAVFGVDKFFFELYGADLKVYDQAFYTSWYPTRNRMGGELNIGDSSSTDAQVAAAVMKLCKATPSGHDLALFGGSSGTTIEGTRLQAVIGALDECTQ
jgi:hypothetical protein